MRWLLLSAVLMVLAGCGAASTSTLPLANPNSVPVVCAPVGNGTRARIDFTRCYQLGRRVRLAILGFGATCDPTDASRGWYLLGGAGYPPSAGSTTLACERRP